jgi:hypothetical protein
MEQPRLHWRRGRSAPETGTLEWIGLDDAGDAIARVVRVLGPMRRGWRVYPAVALDDDAKLIELRPNPPEGEDWLACVGGQVVGRAALPMTAVRTAEAALGAA